MPARVATQARDQQWVRLFMDRPSHLQHELIVPGKVAKLKSIEENSIDSTFWLRVPMVFLLWYAPDT
jgi:hypothetical protein